MLQVTANRFAKIVPWEKIIVITLERYVEQVKKQLPEINPNNIIAEPEKKDTAMAMLTAALFAKSKDPDAVLINDAADHVVTDNQEFLRLMEAGAEVAFDGKYLVSIGITPTHPSTAFGYIKVGDEIKKVDKNIPVFKVENFTEKPKRGTAQAFLTTGRYFWNANNYVWSAKALKAAFKKHMPKMYDQTKHLDELETTEFLDELPEIYDRVEKISIDYAISEKVDNLVLIPGDFGWNDIGEWKVVYDLGKQDLAGNVVVGDEDADHLHTLTVESQNNLIHVQDRLVALVGVKDMIIVDTDEIVMIAPKSHSQEVKKLVKRLKEENKTEYL